MKSKKIWSAQDSPIATRAVNMNEPSWENFHIELRIENVNIRSNELKEV